jgi:hypothetical protein
MAGGINIVAAIDNFINNYIFEPVTEALGAALGKAADLTVEAVSGVSNAALGALESGTGAVADAVGSIGQTVRGDESLQQHQFAGMVPEGLSLSLPNENHLPENEFIGHQVAAGQMRSGQEFFLS